MEYVLNEFSIDEQFNDVDEFLDSLQEATLPILKKLEQNDMSLLKSNNIYTCKITKDDTFYEIIQSKKHSRSYPELSRVKGLLIQLFTANHYWDLDSQIIHDSEYKCEFTDQLNMHCIGEALERNTSIVSFEHDNFKDNKIEVIKDGITSNVNNIYNKDSILSELLNLKLINYSEYLCDKYKNIITFCVINNKNYFEEFIMEASLSNDDVRNIIKDIEDFMYKYNNRLDLGRLSKSIENYYEFRTYLSNNRQIRIFYIMEGNNFVFLNCLLKKQQSTPESAKEKARILIKEYKSYK
ncbi:MAG: type II toxin-antitoxin system RelE/ParE family toxin [Paraclostridium sordellii]